MSPSRADSLLRPSPILEDIWQGIKQSTVLLADLPDCNANVFYELSATRSDIVIPSATPDTG
ncbi:MAG TPA: hypothetical protein VIX89_16970 [Bryobacteraceae bacterium]